MAKIEVDIKNTDVFRGLVNHTLEFLADERIDAEIREGYFYAMGELLFKGREEVSERPGNVKRLEIYGAATGVIFDGASKFIDYQDDRINVSGNFKSDVLKLIETSLIRGEELLFSAEMKNNERLSGKLFFESLEKGDKTEVIAILIK